MTNFEDKNAQKAAELRIYFDLMRVDQIVQVRVNHPLVCLVQSYAHLVFRCASISCFQVVSE